MIDVYSWPAPNPQKIHIMLEETDLPEDRPMSDREWQTMYGSIQFARR